MESGHVMYNKTAGRENNDRDLSCSGYSQHQTALA